jgi:hypothetical protein
VGDLAKAPGPQLLDGSWAYKPLLKEPVSLTRNSVTLTVQEIALLFDRRGMALEREQPARAAAPSSIPGRRWF